MSIQEPPVTFWSFSAIKDFERCPYIIYLKRVARAPAPEISEEATPKHPLVRGERIHKAAEAFIRGESENTQELKNVLPRLQELRSAFEQGLCSVEQRWCFDRTWAPVEWASPDKWNITIVDAVMFNQWPAPTHADVDDWKSGKSFGKEIRHTEQMQTYALATFLRFPSLRTVTTRAQYVDEKGKVRKRDYDRTIIPRLEERWSKRGDRLTNAIDFPAKPNRGNCRYCDFGPNTGTGVCPYGVELS